MWLQPTLDQAPLRIIIPVTISIALITLYIMLGAGLFHAWEDWDMVSAAYFSFITLSTVRATCSNYYTLHCTADWLRRHGAQPEFP